MKTSIPSVRHRNVTHEPFTQRYKPAMVGPFQRPPQLALRRSPMRPFLATSSIVVLALASTACPPTNPGAPPPVPNPVDGTQPSASCTNCYTSIYDNPVMQSTVTLAQRVGPEGRVSDESVSTDANGTLYYNFFLQLTTSGGNAAVGSVSESLPILPYDNQSYDLGDLLTWDGHGMELGYSYSLVEGQNVDAFGSVTLSPPIPGSYALDPTVMLVPLQVIRVLPADPSTSAYDDLWDVSPRAYKKFFDDQPIVNTAHASQPGYEYFSTRYANSTDVPGNVPADQQLSETDAYNFYVGSWGSVDRIWAQCGIQFRMIDCPNPTTGEVTGLGCPDLLVKTDAEVSPTTCEYNPGSFGNGDLPTLRANWMSAFALPGVRGDLPIVITMASIVNASLCTVGFPRAESQTQETGLGLYEIHNADQPTYIVAHEMGLLLGLPEEDCSQSNQTPHLMCMQDTSETAEIRPAECALARQKAAVYTKAMWGVTVTP